MPETLLFCPKLKTISQVHISLLYSSAIWHLFYFIEAGTKWRYDFTEKSTENQKNFESLELWMNDCNIWFWQITSMDVGFYQLKTHPCHWK